MSIKIKQQDITDCGPACLASVFEYYDVKVPIARLRQKSHTDKKGTSALGLVNAARFYGFDSSGVEATFQALQAIDKPVIAHVELENRLQHYVVVYKITPDHVEIMDPAQGEMLTVSNSKFKSMWSGVLILITPSSSHSAINEKVPFYKRFTKIIRPHWDTLLGNFVAAITITVLGFAPALYIGEIVDRVVVDNNSSLLQHLTIIVALLLLLELIITIVKDVYILRMSKIMDGQIILGYYKHLMKLPLKFFHTMRTGETLSRISDAFKIRFFISSVMVALTLNALILISSIVFILLFNWKLGLLMLSTVPIYALIYFISNKLNKSVERRLMERGADLESHLVESLNNMDTIKAYGLEAHSNNKTAQVFASFVDTTFRSGLNASFSSISSNTIARLFTILLLFVGGHFVLSDYLTIGQLVSFYAVVGYFTGPMNALIGANKQIQSALIAADRLFDIMDLDKQESKGTKVLTESTIGDIVFKGVNFSYGARGKTLDDIFFTIPYGKTTAIIGHSGCGKSTVAKLIQNLYSIQSGSITIGDYKVTDICPNSLKDTIGYVAQSVDIFSGTITDNIALGEDDPDLSIISSICWQVGLVDFLDTLPDKLNTFLGENGTSLSGGQRQKIGLARALYRQPKILILDEATVSIEKEMEEQILSSLKKSDLTLVIITHDPRLITSINHKIKL